MIDVTARMADGRQVGMLGIHCIEGTGLSPDSINTYSAVIHTAARGDTPATQQVVTFQHRFGDPWTVLVQKALEAAEVTNHWKESPNVQ